MRIGKCDWCGNKNRYLDKGKDSSNLRVINVCAYGCENIKSVPVEEVIIDNPGEIDNWMEELREVRNKMIETTILKDSDNESAVTLLNDTETTSYSIGLKTKNKNSESKPIISWNYKFISKELYDLLIKELVKQEDLH